MAGSILVVTFDTSTGIRTGRLVGSALLEDGAVLSGKIGSGQVASGHLTAALIASIEAGVADEAITSAKLASGAVIGDRIADAGIFSGKIASGAIGPSTLLANAIITSAKIASGIIGWPHIGSEAILSGHLGSGQIASGHLVSAIAALIGTVADGGITSAKVASGIIAGVHIEDGSILSGEIGAGEIGDTLLKDFGLLSGKYASGSVTEQALVSGISIDVAETTKEPGYRAAVIMSAYDPAYVAAVSGNYVGIAIALSGTMPAIGIAAANIASGSLGDINYGGRAPALASVVSGQYGRPVFVGASGTGLTMTPPSTSGYCQQIMGAVKDDDEIMLFPEPGYIEIA